MISQIECFEHKKQAEHFCVSEKYKYEPVCAECRKSKKYPLSDVISVIEAYTRAETNLSAQDQLLEQHMKPIQNKQELETLLQRQKKLLESQRKRLLDAVHQIINYEIKQLESKNKLSFEEQQRKILIQMNNQKNKIRQLRTSMKNNLQKLRDAINYNANYIIKYQEQIRQRETRSADIIYKYDEPITHEITISTNQLKVKHLNRGGDGMGGSFFTVRPPKRKLNISPLYFKIDSPTTSQTLYYFYSNEQMLRIFNLQSWRWHEHHSPTYMNSKADTVKYEQTYYLIGGQQHRQPSNKILFYDDRNKQWGNLSLKTARRSPMAISFQNKIYIVGGQSASTSLKSFEILDLRTHTIKESQYYTNFSTSSGTLVNFNEECIFKIGGVNTVGGQRNILHIIQRMDSSEQWQFVEIDYSAKPQMLFNTYQAAIQINSNQIMVFGGTKSHSSYLLEVQKVKGFFENVTGEKYGVKWINEKPLISNDNFEGCKPVIYDSSVCSLQNVTNYQLEKRLIQFDMYEWHETANIVIG